MGPEHAALEEPSGPADRDLGVVEPGPRSLPLLGWGFLLLAGLVGLSWAASFVQGPAFGGALAVIAAVVGVAIPAALLYRVPSAWRSHRLLLAGLAAGSVSGALSRALMPLFVASSLGAVDPWRQFALWAGPAVLGVAGMLLVALGLARLRERPPSRGVRRLLPVLVLAELVGNASVFLYLVTHPGSMPPPSCRPRWPRPRSSSPVRPSRPTRPGCPWPPGSTGRRLGPFWVLLGVAALAGLAGLAPYLATNVVLALGSSDLFVFFVPLTTLDEALAVAAAPLAFVAYARFTPPPPQAITLLSGA
ncbi:MAG: hypothetical protein ACLQHS_09355 [Candidatus Limnocylindrales bacterium]